MAEKKIDIIIPAYKAHEVLQRALGSIITQSVVDSIKVTIVNDSDENDYHEFVEAFKDFVTIEEIKLNVNGGPGVARQYGIDHTTCPYFTCIDADDSLASPFAIQRLLFELEQDPTIVVNVGSFAEDHGDMTFLQHDQDLVWMFGKMYRRSFITKYNIRFNDTRANEDNGFNTMVRLIASETEKINFITDIVYYWRYKEDSITRINNAEYSYNQSFPGYATNMIYAIVEARKKKPFNSYIDVWAIQVMAQLYVYYYQTVARAPKFAEQNLKSCVEYYTKVFKEISQRFTQENFNEIFSQVIQQQAPNMAGVIPEKTIYQFIELLRQMAQIVSEAQNGEVVRTEDN